jgi:hypothetical protein
MLPLPMSFDIPLPRWARLPQTVIAAGVLGFVYGKLANAPAFSCAKIFAITQLANSILFFLVKEFLHIPDCYSQYQYSVLKQQRNVLTFTTIVSQIIGIIAMRYFNLIATRGCVLWSMLTMGIWLLQSGQMADEECLSLDNILAKPH